MKVRIMCNHPIATQQPPQCWDGEVHDFDGSWLDLKSVGAFVTKKTGIRFDYSPRYSRREGNEVILFPKRRQTGIHCMWLEEVRETHESTR